MDRRQPDHGVLDCASSPIIGFVVETRGTDFASLAYPDAQEVGLKVVTLDDSTVT